MSTFLSAEMDQIAPSTLTLTRTVDYIHLSCFHRYDPKNNTDACEKFATDVGTDGKNVTEACCVCGGGSNAISVSDPTNPTSTCVDYKDWKESEDDLDCSW